MAWLTCRVEGTMTGYQVSEDVVLHTWEEFSDRLMNEDERSRARGHALVDYLRHFSEVALREGARSAQLAGQDLDWRAWRTAVERAGSKRQYATRGSRSRSVEPKSDNDTREIRKGAWKGRSQRAIDDAELMRKLRKKYPKA